MERLLQYLDELEDLIYAVVLLRESLRRVLRFFCILSASLAVQASAVILALAAPPIAVAVASLLLVGMLYRGVVYNVPMAAAAT